MVAIKHPDGTWDIEGLEPWWITFERMCKMLKVKESFKFARYGDGEIYCMSGRIGRNCDKHEYFPELGLALHQAAENADYMVGIQPLSVSQGLHKDNFDYESLYNADVLHNASIKGMLGKFMNELADRDTILVGPEHLSKVADVYISIPSVNCWKEYDNVRQLLWFALHDNPDAVVLLCASMMSEVLIDKFKDHPNTFIDCGSVFDPYHNVKSRRYHHNLKINEHH
jgi:hypothetical protein